MGASTGRWTAWPAPLAEMPPLRSLLTRAATLLLSPGTLLAMPSPAPAASVEVMVSGEDRTLSDPRSIPLAQRSVRVGGRRCGVGDGTPLSALLGARLRVAGVDRGSCGRSPRAAGGLRVTRVGPDRDRGRGRWAYKVGRRTGTRPPADPAGSLELTAERDGMVRAFPRLVAVR